MLLWNSGSWECRAVVHQEKVNMATIQWCASLHPSPFVCYTWKIAAQPALYWHAAWGLKGIPMHIWVKQRVMSVAIIVLATFIVMAPHTCLVGWVSLCNLGSSKQQMWQSLEWLHTIASAGWGHVWHVIHSVLAAAGCWLQRLHDCRLRTSGTSPHTIYCCSTTKQHNHRHHSRFWINNCKGCRPQVIFV